MSEMSPIVKESHARATYELGCIMGEIIRWWQEKHPEVHRIELGYGTFGGPSVGIAWSDTKGDTHYHYCDVEAIGWRTASETIPAQFERALAEHPPRKVRS